MVFESLVADLLNKYLGHYVKNLDASQLKIGIWGGNVVLSDLELKETALDDLDLPIKVVRGYLGKLVLSIPWKNLYTESTVVDIEDLHLVAKPNFDIKYNEEKEEKHKHDKKQKQLENIEEARLREKEKNKEKKEESDSFAEKLATNVIKNLQIKIKNIHVRYEDSISDVNGPFSVGLTMESLTAQTTDIDFVPKIIKESVTLIHKMVKLDNLALYWNPGDELTSPSLNTKEWVASSQKQISTHASKPENTKYILSPMVASKKMKINTKPGHDLNIPQIFLNLVLEELGIIIARSQYHGVVQLIESFERMNHNQPFRKYRPHVPAHGNPQIWWKYCISSILEIDVKRRTKMWSWINIKKHRILCKAYKAKYKEKLKQKSPPQKLLSELEAMENDLNIASITIFRQLAESEVISEAKKSKENKGGFFSLFSRSKDKEKSTAGKIEDLMGDGKDKEMKKLYDAIGYSENEVITPFPKEYIAVMVESVLQKLFISLVDDSNKKRVPFNVLDFSLNNIIVEVFQRPSAQALKLCVKVGGMKLFGTPSNDCTPLMIKNLNAGRGMEFIPLVNFIFETNPLKKPDIDQCITAVCQPIEIIYDANTINHIISFFEPPEHVILRDLQEKAYSTFEDFKVSSTAGLLHAMEQRTIMDIDIDISASHLIIPENGSYNGCTDMLVVDFGNLKMSSDPSQIRTLDPKDIDDVDEVQSKAYDRFLFSLSDLQILLVKEGEDLKSAKSNTKINSSHILHPIGFDGKLAKAILQQDPRLKQICVSGSLSTLLVSVSDEKVSRLIKLADSIPLPKTSDAPGDTESSGLLTKALSMISLTGDNDDLGGGFSIPVPSSVAHPTSNSDDDDEFQTPPESSILSLKQEEDPSFSSGVANQVKVDLNFNIQQIKITVGLTDKVLKQEQECLEFIVDDISTEVVLRRWDMFVNADIGRLVLNEMTWGPDGEPVQVLSTPKNTKMLKISYRRCEFNESLSLGPSYFYSKEAQVRALHFKDEFQATEQILDVQVATLFLVLHQEALLSIMSLIYQVLEPLNKHDAEATQKIKRSLSTAGSRLSLSIDEKQKQRKKPLNQKSMEAAQELKKEVGLEEEKAIRVTASMDGVGIMICSAKVDLAQAYVKGLSAKVLMKDEILEVKASMKDMQVQDNAGVTKYKDIVSMRSDEVFDLELVLYENGTCGSKQYDVSFVDTMVKLNFGQMRVVFLYRFIQDLIAFVDNFEDAKTAVIEAGKAAKDKAVEKASDLNRHSSRVRLNILLKAPTIVIPVGSNSELALCVDLGEVRVFNSFKLLNDDRLQKKTIITDNMTVKLSNLNLSKSLIKDGKEIKHQRDIVEPMTLQVNIIRNLTPSNHSMPDVAVKGSMPAITLSISEEDLTVVLKIVQGNIAEGESRVPKKKTKPSKKAQLDLPQDRLADIYEEPVEDGGGYLQTNLSFDLAKIDIKLYLKPSDMTFEDEFLPRTDDLLLALFTIGNLIVKGKIMSDQSLSMVIQLETLILDDMRPIEEQDVVKRMINYSPDPLLEEVTHNSFPVNTKYMIDVLFEQTATQDRCIDVKLCNLLCIFNVEFIMVLVKTLQAAIPKEDEMERPRSLSSLDSHQGSGGSEDEDVSDTQDMITTSSFIDDENESRSETKLILSVHNPQIVLLADAKDIKTNALFLTTEITFQYFELKEAQKMIGAVSNTAILSTAFKEEHRSDISTVLSLDSINLHSSAPINGKPHISLTTTLVKLNISPKTIRTLSACSGYIATGPTEEEIKVAQKAMSALWNINEFTAKRSWYLNNPPQHVLSAGSFVLARTASGEYKHGFLAKKDTSFQVYFYPEGTITHKATDISSVVLDINPLGQDLFIGCNVLAVDKDKGYRPGRVMQIWSPEKNEEAMDGVKQSQVAKEGGDGGSFVKYLVSFYHNARENYFLPEDLRIIGKLIKGVVPGVGACVYARYNDGFYYRGMVDRIHEYRVRILYDEINGEIEHDVDDPSAVILNMTPQVKQVKKHFKVIASKGSTLKGYHPGKVTAIQGETVNRLYSVRFEDGTTNQVPITKLVLMPKANYDALPEVGTYVYSRVSRDAPLYEKGIVVEKKKDLICIKHLNGRKLAHEKQNINFVVRNIIPLMSSLKVGLDVIAQPDNDDQKMYLAVIKEVTNKEGDKSSRYLVEFTDGSKKRVTPSRIRILSQYGSSAAGDAEESTDVVVVRQEELVIDVQGVSLRVEGYLGGALTPMLKMESKITANLKDWSSKMVAQATATLQASYYNENVAEWEPVIEPLVENRRERPWQLSIKYSVEEDAPLSTSNELVDAQKPASKLRIKSQDNLEVTLSKSCIGLLGELGKVFGDAVESIDVLPKILVEKEPFTIENLDTDTSATEDSENIGVYMQKIDALIRQIPASKVTTGFSCQTKDFHDLLFKIADKRHRDVESELKCYKRLIRDSKRFEKIFQERAAKNPNAPYSEELHENHAKYWGTRQQLLAGKVICDWLCEDHKPPMDPIFGVLLNPTAGRVGPGDSGWFHNLLYDNSGEWAHHSAVHDGFGYLLNFHEIGPGYNYMYKSFFDKDNPLAGQISGIDFWKKYVKEVEMKLKVIENFKDL